MPPGGEGSRLGRKAVLMGQKLSRAGRMGWGRPPSNGDNYAGGWEVRGLFYSLIMMVITLLYTFVKNHRPAYDIHYIIL